MVLFGFMAALLQAGWTAPMPPDSVEALRDQAQRAESEYERLLRRLAPRTWSSSGGRGSCDEIVGRFCLRFSDDPDPPPALEDSGQIIRARRDAVAALRRAFSAAPGDLFTAGPLVRYLVEDGRVGEGVSAARTFASISQDSVWGAMLMGFALHQAARDTAAQRYFALALARLPPEERRRMTSVDLLLSHDERDHYEDLDKEARTAYDSAFWTLADPLYLTPGNERQAEHLARHVWVRALSQAPLVAGMHRWGDDLAELTMRYGVPTSRARQRETGFSLSPRRLAEQMIEWWDPDQLRFVQPALRTEGVPSTPLPGVEWALDTTRARSGYAPASVRRIVSLPHAVSRFPAGDSVLLRVDGLFPLDSATQEVTSVESGLFVLDRSHAFVRERRTGRPADRDTLRLTFQVVLPPGHYTYSLEALADDDQLGGRARYSVVLDAPPPASLALSDLVVSEPFGARGRPQGRDDPRFQPRADMMLTAGDTVGLFAEVHDLASGPDGLTGYEVELTVRRREDASLPVRAVRWLGRALGLGGPTPLPRLAWEAEGERGRVGVIAVDVPFVDIEPGDYTLELAVTDQRTGSRREVIRHIRIREERQDYQ